MLLHDVFMALCLPNITLTFQEETLKRCDLEYALKNKVKSSWTLNASSPMVLYEHFLEHCKKALEKCDERALLEVIISAWASDESPLDEIVACNTLTQLFYLNLNNQEDVSKLASLGCTLIYLPKAFAAFVRCLVWQGMNPMQILSTHLLQNFFCYYLNTLDDPNNSITQLYRILHTFPETQSLCRLARKVRCDEGGPIDGTAPIHVNDLIKIELNSVPISFTPTICNLKGLHGIFGVDFLFHGISQKNNSQFSGFFEDVCNQAYVVETQLADLLKGIQDYPALHQPLAAVLNDHTLDILVQKKVINVLCLIPYRPNIVNFIQMYDLANYLQDICKESSSELALISGLFALLNAIKSTNDVAARLVFDVIVDVVICAPSYVFEDASFIRNFNNYSQNIDGFIQKIQVLEAGLDAIIHSQMQSSIDMFDYITIEDTWRSVATKIKNLQEIITLKSTCPTDKYQLYKRVARIFFAQKNAIDLDAFLRALGIEPQIEENKVNVYERCIIELLGEIDDDAFRMQCIQRLNEHVTRPWRTFVYGDKDLLKRAALAGNLGLIIWLEGEQITPSRTFEELSLDAAREKHWPIVEHFHKQHGLKKTTLNTLLQMAIKQNFLSAIPLLWCKHRPKPTLALIETEFSLAVQKNDYAITNCLIHCRKPPSDKRMATALKQAIANKYFDIVKLLIENKSGEYLQNAIEEAFFNAARLNQSDVIHTLTPYSSVLMNENALLKAVRANHLNIVQLLAELPHLRPRIETLERAYFEANKKEKRAPIAAYLAALCDAEKRASTKTQKKELDEESNTPIQFAPSASGRIPKPLMRRSATYDVGLNRHTFFQLSENLIEKNSLKRPLSCESLVHEMRMFKK